MASEPLCAVSFAAWAAPLPARNSSCVFADFLFSGLSAICPPMVAVDVKAAPLAVRPAAFAAHPDKRAISAAVSIDRSIKYRRYVVVYDPIIEERSWRTTTPGPADPQLRVGPGEVLLKWEDPMPLTRKHSANSARKRIFDGSIPTGTLVPTAARPAIGGRTGSRSLSVPALVPAVGGSAAGLTCRLTRCRSHRPPSCPFGRRRKPGAALLPSIPRRLNPGGSGRFGLNIQLLKETTGILGSSPLVGGGAAPWQ